MKRTKKLFIILTFSLIFSFLLFSSSTLVRADDEPEPKKNAERIVTIDNDGSSVKLTSILKYSEDKDDFTIDISTINELSFKGLYKSHTDSNKINLEFQLRFYSIIEYLDVDEDGIYDTDVDTYVGEYDIDEFSPIEYSNGDTHILVIETTDGVFLARVFAVEGISNINGIIVTPMEVKIDFEIHNFDYIESDSRLALLVHFQTNAAYGWNEKDHGEEEPPAVAENEVEMKNRDATGYFSWADTAIADGQDVEVIGSPLKDSGNGKKMYLNYPHATDIIHDPKIGFVGNFSLVPFYIIIGTVGMVAIVAVVVFIKKKR